MPDDALAKAEWTLRNEIIAAVCGDACELTRQTCDGCPVRLLEKAVPHVARAVLEAAGVIPSKQEQTLFWQALEQYIARLRTIPQVGGLRIWQDGRNICIYILLRNEHYEDDVMEKLVNPEMELINTARGLQLDFQYIPVLIVPEETIIPPEAKLVYWADDEVSLTKTGKK